MSKRDYYEVLGVARTASAQEIRSAYRKLAREHHPDLNGGNVESEERFKEANEAYEVLSDEQKRSMYDRFGHAAVGGAPGGVGFDGGLGDIFEQFFSGFARQGGQPRRTGPRAGNDLRQSATISFEEAVRGTTITVDVSRLEQCESCHGSGAAPGSSPVRCPQCSGSGEVRTARQSIFGQIVVTDTCPRCRGEGEIVSSPCPQCHGQKQRRVTRRREVDIPPGIDDGMRIRLQGEGDEGLRGGPPGSLFVDISVKPHEYFRRDGQTILLDLELNVAQATLGDEITVPTIDGPTPLTIPAGTQTGQVFRLRNKGAPHIRNETLRGDMLVNIFVKVPQHLTAEQRELFKQLAETLGAGSIQPQHHKGGFFDRIRDAFK